ncbi:MAG: hypothetical protein RR144_03215 [Clostridia bacterium]
MSTKRKLCFIILSIALYFILNIVYQKYIIKDNYSYVYILKNDVVKGEKIDLSCVQKVKMTESKDFNCYLNIDDNYVFSKSYYKGNILLKDMILNKDEYMKLNKGNELVSIKLKFSDDAASYQIKKGDIVNIYCSAKLMEISNVLKSINNENILSNNLENGYVTIKLFEKVQIIDCYNKSGNKVNKNNNEVVETIMIEVLPQECIKLNSLKKYSDFSVSIVK